MVKRSEESGQFTDCIKDLEALQHNTTVMAPVPILISKLLEVSQLMSLGPSLTLLSSRLDHLPDPRDTW